MSFGDLSGGTSDAADGATDSGTSGDATFSDGGRSDGAVANDSGNLGDGACQGTAGPASIRVGQGASSYCIDSTEVTLRHYQQFLAALDAGATATQPPECAFNVSFATTDLRTDTFTPINGVDWCDAYAFCAWAGKRLCGKIGGGSLAPASVGDPSASQWLAACAHASDGGIEQYPYGNTLEPTACNTGEVDAGTLVEVGSLPKCVGGYPGMFDMSGNADEWIDSCDGTTGSTDCCLSVGGGYNDTQDSCGVGGMAPPACPGRTRADKHGDLGFRCCSD